MNVELGQAYIWHGLILQIHQYPENEDRDGRRNIGFLPLNQVTWLVARENFIRSENGHSAWDTVWFNPRNSNQ
jgi:hypothetical protein